MIDNPASSLRGAEPLRDVGRPIQGEEADRTPDGYSETSDRIYENREAEADAWVGESKVLQRVLPIAENEVRLIERVDNQLISFNWPLGATMVEVPCMLTSTPRHISP